MATRTDARRHRGLRAALVAAPIALAAVAFAAPAAADEATFTDDVASKYVFLGDDAQVQSMGRQVCSILSSGRPASDAVAYLDRTDGLSPTDALAVIRSASVNLGC
jgi:hypothetical protein